MRTKKNTVANSKTSIERLVCDAAPQHTHLEADDKSQARHHDLVVQRRVLAARIAEPLKESAIRTDKLREYMHILNSKIKATVLRVY